MTWCEIVERRQHGKIRLFRFVSASSGEPITPSRLRDLDGIEYRVVQKPEHSPFVELRPVGGVWGTFDELLQIVPDGSQADVVAAVLHEAWEARDRPANEIRQDEPPTLEDGDAVVARLGIDVKAWAADVRERVKAATEKAEAEGAADELPPVGSLVAIHADADGSGSLAQGVLARVTGHTTGSYGFVPMILVEPVNGPSDDMRATGLDRLDLYRDEYDLVTP